MASYLKTMHVNSNYCMEIIKPLHSPKSRLEMIRVSAAVMGIEFCYAAETAFVSPILLKIGVQHRLMTLIWCLSPIVGFFLTPVLGESSGASILLLAFS